LLAFSEVGGLDVRRIVATALYEEGRALRRMSEYWMSVKPILALVRATLVSFSLAS
jgi:hypothetical protein